tara:strand:- start:183 stop:491 length:309 start_codon:yes stop_codon:yes gene_type:complete
MKPRLYLRCETKSEEQILIDTICHLADCASEELTTFPQASAATIVDLRHQAEAILDALCGMADEAIEREATCSSCDGLGEDPRTDTPCGDCNGRGGWDREVY